MNTIKQPEPEVVVAKPVEESKPVKAAKKIMSSINIFSFMEKDKIIKLLPFVFFSTMLALIYIANSYYAEKTIREIDSTGKEIKELRSEFISVQSELMMKCKQTEVLNEVQAMGIKQSLEPPKKIIVESQKSENN